MGEGCWMSVVDRGVCEVGVDSFQCEYIDLSLLLGESPVLRWPAHVAFVRDIVICPGIEIFESARREIGLMSRT